LTVKHIKYSNEKIKLADQTLNKNIPDSLIFLNKSESRFKDIDEQLSLLNI